MPTFPDRNYYEPALDVSFTVADVEDSKTKQISRCWWSSSQSPMWITRTYSRTSVPLISEATTHWRPPWWLEDGNHIPIFKKGNKQMPSNYRPVSLTYIPCKILEHIVRDIIVKHLDLMDRQAVNMVLSEGDDMVLHNCLMYWTTGLKH